MADNRQVPDSAIVACPMRPGSHVSVKEVCLGCEHLRGIGVYNEHPSVPWRDAHQVLCTYPRRLAVTDLVGAPSAALLLQSRAETFRRSDIEDIEKGLGGIIDG